jgi:hypothetical protein
LIFSGPNLPLRVFPGNRIFSLLKQNQKMKKVFAILAMVGFMVACNNKSEKKTEETTDTTKMEDNKMMDTTNKMMDTSTKMMDTTSKMQ